MEENKIPAKWPYDPEIFYHLDFIPFIDLKINFDAQSLYQEAFNLLPHFVLHREQFQKSIDQKSKWRSLALRSYKGDPNKTEYHKNYQFDADESCYQNTSFLEKCPKTVEFLEKITDINQCDRIRFMLLEPGAEILTHRDSQTRDVSIAVNISLNMPKSCHFWCDLNIDGSANNFTKLIPFKDNGSVILFNNAKFHRVENKSNEYRIHLIFHGPIRISDNAILTLAQAQNQIHTRKDLLKKLIIKKNLLGENLYKNSSLIPDWIQSGLTFDIFEDHITIIVIKHKCNNQDSKNLFALENITCASLFPIKFKVVGEEVLDTFLQETTFPEDTFIVFCTAGLFIKNLYSFIFELFAQINTMKNEKSMVAGHILDHDDNRLPFFHEQFLIINFKEWSLTGKPPLKLFFSGKKYNMNNYFAGPSLNKSYTPSYIKTSEKQGSVKHGIENWGTRLINASLNKKLIVLNINEKLRNAKIYSYPNSLNHPNQEEIKEIIKQRIKSAQEDVFTFNNEELSIVQINSLKPKCVISVAAGFKSLKIFEQYNLKNDSEIHYVDFSRNSLNYIKGISQSRDLNELRSKLTRFAAIFNPQYFSRNFSSQLLEHTIKEYFYSNEDLFLSKLKLNEKANYHLINIVFEPEKLVEIIPTNKEFIIWTSNVYYNSHLYHLIGENEANKRFLQLCTLISIRTQLTAFILKDTQTVLFGRSIKNPLGLLTDGAAKELSTHIKDYIIINRGIHLDKPQ